MSPLLRVSFFLALLARGGLAQEQDEDPEMLLLRADELHRQGDHLAALPLLEELRDDEEYLDHVHRLLARVYDQLDRPEDARREAAKALGRGFLTEDVLSLLASLDQRSDHPVLALQGLRLLVLVKPETAVYQILLAEMLEDSGALKEALAVYDHLARQDPAGAEIEVRRANLLLRLGRDMDALEAFERGWWLGHASPGLPGTLARLWSRSATPARALPWFERAADDDPGLRTEWANLALSMGRLDDAEKLANELLEAAEPATLGRAKWMLGQIAQLRGDDDAALTLWVEAVDAGFSSPNIRRFLGVALYRAGRVAEAVPHFEASLEAGTDPDTIEKLVFALVESGRVDEAKPWLVRWLVDFGPTERQHDAVRVWRNAKSSPPTDRHLPR